MHRWPFFLAGAISLTFGSVTAYSQPPALDVTIDSAPQPEVADETSPTPAFPTPSATDPAEIARWIQELDSDAFSTRVRATKQLFKAGRAAIEPLARELPNYGREATTRGVYVLRQLTIEGDDQALQEAAAAGLETLAQSELSTSSQIAKSALGAIYELWSKQAVLQLRQNGAIFSNTPIITPRNAQQIFRSISFGTQWHGNLADLSQIARVTNRRYREPAPPWMVIYEGVQVTDEWLDTIATTPGIAVVRLSSTRITNDGVRRIVDMPDVQAIELLYNEINDDCLESLASNPQVMRLRLIGNRISYEGADRLRQMAAHAEIDFRAGGFLGVACTDNPCRISHVQDNSAAARAGFRINDVIISYNGQPVKSMDELIRAIAKHGVGEKVTVEVERDDSRFTRELVLGKWD